MIGALLRDLVRRHLPLVVGGGVVAALVLGSGWSWPLEVWAPVWALVLTVGVVMAGLFESGDGVK